jgi:hypothetical protein
MLVKEMRGKKISELRNFVDRIEHWSTRICNHSFFNVGFQGLYFIGNCNALYSFQFLILTLFSTDEIDASNLFLSSRH